MSPEFRQLLFILPKGALRRGAAMVSLFLVQAIIEVIGVTSVVPFMAIAAQPERIRSNPTLHWLYSNLHIQSNQDFVALAGVGVLALLGLTNFVSAATTWYSSRYFSWLTVELSTRLLNSYLSRSYQWFLSHSFAVLNQAISETHLLSNAILLSALRLLSRMAVTVMIVIILLFADPIIAVTSFVLLGGSYLLIYLKVRRKLFSLSYQKRCAEVQRFKISKEAIEGVKAVILQNRKSHFLDQFRKHSEAANSINHRLTFTSEAPRYILEFLALGSVIIIVVVLFRVKGDIRAALPILTLYTFSAYRLLPALQQSFSYITSIKVHQLIIPNIYRYLSDPTGLLPETSGDEAALDFQRGLRLKNISFAYPGNANTVLHDIEIDIAKNSSVAFVGPTGAGKSTIIDLVLGLLHPTQGSIQIDDTPLDRENIRQWQRNLGYVPQDIYLTDDTIRANIAFAIPEKAIDDAQVEHAARLANLHDFILSLPQGYQTVVGDRGVRLSGGQRQRIGIARALYSDPSVLVLDEATSALDSITERAVIEAVSNLAAKKTIIMIAHRLTTVRGCDQIYLLENGRVAAIGTYDELIQSNKTFQDLAAMPSQQPPEDSVRLGTDSTPT